MKKIYKLMTLLLCCAGAFTVASCSDDDEIKGGKFPLVESPLESVTAIDGNQTAIAVISDAEKTIKFQFEELVNLTAVPVTVKAAPGALLKTPAHATVTLDLTKPYSVVVHNGKTEITYTLTALPSMPVTEAKVGTEKAVIDEQTITIAYQQGMNINAMVFDFTLKPGAVIESPENKTFDLEFEAGQLVVVYKEKEFTYTVKQTGYTDPLLSQGWADVSGSYGTLPAYIKVYKNEDLLKNAATKSLGYIAIMGAKATMSALGDGVNAMKNIYTLADANPTWNVLMVGVSATAPQQTIIRNGQFFQNPITPNSYGTFGQNKDGSYKTAWTQKFDNKLYAFPFRNGTTFEARAQADGTVWDAQTAVSGIPMILWDNNVLTAEQTICNDGGNNNWYDGNPAPRYARSAIGLTAYGKVIVFCGQQVDGSVGLSMLELAQIMKDCGCVSAVNFEGSSTPNMLVNKMETVKNSRVYDAAGALLGKDKAKAVQIAIAFK